MSKQEFMEALSPKKLCKKQALIEGHMSVSEFSRFSSIGAGSGTVNFSLNFDQDEQGRASVKGYARSQRTLVCQRCLKEVSRELNTRIDLRIVATEERAAELENLDSVVMEGDTLSLVELIEDDLILGVPEQVCPDPEACEHTPQFVFPDRILEEKHSNPFDVLAKLKADKK